MKIDDYLNQAIIFRTYKIPHVEAHKAVTEKYSQEPLQGNSKPQEHLRSSKPQESQGSSKPQGFQRSSKPQESIYDQKILGAPLMLEGYKWPMFTNESGKTYPMSFYAQFFDPTKPLQTEFIQIFVSDLSDIENACMGTKVIHIRKIPLMDILCKKPVESYFKDGEIDEDKLTVYILNGKEIKLPNTNLEVHEKMKEKSMKRGYDEKLPTNVSGKIVKWNLVYTCADEDCDDIPEEVTEICEDYYFYMQNDISTLLQVGGINNSCQRNVYEETYYHCIYNYYYADGGSLSTTETGETYGDSC